MNLQKGQISELPSQSPSTSAGDSRRSGDEQLIRLNLRRALQLHWRLAAAFAAAGLLLAVAYAVLKWPVYIAKSQIYVQPVQPKVMTGTADQNVSVNAAAYDSYIQQQVQSSSSPAVLINALKKLGPGSWQQKNESEPVAADRLGHSVDAARVGTSYEVAITARAGNPGLAADIANAVAASIAEKASGEGNAGDAERIAVLRDERERIQNELKADYAEQEDLNKQLGMASVGTTPPDMIDDQIAKTREELIKAQTDHDQAGAKFSAMKVGQGVSSAAIDAEADDLINADPGLSSMKTSLNQRRAVLITQMANLTPQNPGYKLAADELTKINTSLDTMMKELRSNASARIQQKLRTDLERTSRVEAQLNSQLRELAHTAAGATPKLQRVNDLATDIVRLRNRYSAVDEQLHNLMLEDRAPGAVHVSVAAVPPLHPSLGKILKGALPLALGGILLGLLCAVIKNWLDPRVYIAADVERALGFAPMALLPDFNEVSEGVAAEHALRLAASIEHAGRKADLQTCIFTSPSGNTGVSTVARRVKDTLGLIGRSAVLIDATGKTQPAEDAHEETTALGRQSVSRNEFAPETLVLVDTAPILLSAETEYLARSVDGAIVVVESGVTTRAQLQAVVNTLQRLEVGTVGFVLNKVGSAKADPAFRHSLRDMEKHLLNQGGSSSMWPVKWHGVIHESTPSSEIPTAASTALPQEAETPREAAAETDPMAGFVLRRPAAAQPSEQQPAPPSGAEKTRSLMAPVPQSEPEPPACAAQPIQKDYPAAPPQKIVPPRLPDWFWNKSSGGSSNSEQLSAPSPQPAPEPEPSEAESRIERLRGLFTNVGLSELQRSRAPQAEPQLRPAAPHARPEPQLTQAQAANAVQQPVEHPVQAPVAAKALIVEIPAAQPPEPQIAAKPEILSPKDFMHNAPPVRKAQPQSYAAWDDDDIHTLPSRPGQYAS